jgi:Carboxypeptidase regulatory-like domain
MSPLKGIRITLIATLIIACAAAIGSAQEFRGSITGRVLDNNGAAVANAAVTITNAATNVSSSTTTNESGDYTALYLIPGSYTVTVEASGFKKSTRKNIEIRVGDKLQIDMQLEVGSVSDTVNVTTDAPMLETNTATAGQVIDRRRISELPLSDGNPFTLTRLATGIGYVGDLKFSRPFDNNGSSDFISNGASRAAGHEFTLDGIPNTDDNGGSSNRVAFIPPADAVQEFKVETASFDAQQGHGAGATVNVSLRSGSNSLHGTAYEFIRNDVLSANDYFLNRTNLVSNPARDKNKDGKADRDPLRYNRYGGTIGGPIVLPKKIFGPLGYDGRNKTFFFFAYEGLKDVFPEPRQDTVPTLAQRNGDFSTLLGDPLRFTVNTSNSCAGPRGTVVTITNRDGSPARAGAIYNPATAQTVSRCNPLSGRVESRVERLPFAGNIISPELINPIAKAYLQFYPLPNQPGNAQGRNNFISGNPRTDTFHSESYRFDQTVSDKQKLSFRYTHNDRLEKRNNWTGEVNGIIPTGNFLTRKNDGFSADHVYTFSPTTILNARIGFSRFVERNARPSQGQIDPASLGFSSRSAAFFGDASYLPRFQISGDGANSPFTPLGDTLGDVRTHNIYAAQPTLTKIVGDHSFKIGYDFRSYRDNSVPAGHAAGRYDFGTNFTRGPRDNSTGAIVGQELASFLLGQPTGGAIDRNATRANQTLYQGIFFHDDWKVSQKLTLNLGLRYELEGATTERFNRNTRGFDPNVSSPIEAAAKAAYDANPIAEIPKGSFSVKGGLLFADDQNRGFWETDKNNIQPRIGLAYQLNQKTVLRGGFGVYTAPFVIDGVNQTGFSQSTNIVASLDTGLTLAPACATCGNLFDPFPSGVAEPPGASLGAGTFLGRGFTFVNLDRRNGQTQRWEFSVQRELPGQWLVEAAYIGNRSYNLTTSTDITNTLPRQFLSTSPVRDETLISSLNENFTGSKNPFFNLIPGQGFNGTVSRAQLLRPFPQFTDIVTQRYDGWAIYHAGQFRVERRFSRGYTFLSSYTWSKVVEKVSFLNDSDTEYERRIGTDDIPHRIVISGIWELPFGKGRKWGRSWNGFIDAFLGGWQAQGIYQWQSGRPMDLDDRNVFFNGDPSKLRAIINGETVDGTFDTSGFYFSDAAVQTNGVVDPAKQRDDDRIDLDRNIRTFPSRFSGFRGQNLNLWDLSVIKTFSITEGVKFQLRGEFLNAFNHPQFGNPNTDPANANFGRVTSQTNLPRNVQIGLKLIF